MLRDAIQGAGERLLSPASLLSGAFRQGELLEQHEHRPWPIPEAPWVMFQSWTGLLFAHWRVEPAALKTVMPEQLPLDTYDGSAWVGVTPFVVRNARLRGTTPVPRLSTFAEINVRTYVTLDGKPGIYFLSLDAASCAAVRAARATFRLPYFRARIAAYPDGDGFSYHALRTSDDGPPVAFRAEYGPRGEPVSEQPESLERWLTERYCLYVIDEIGRVHRAEIHHPPWPLSNAWAEIGENSMGAPHGLELGEEPLLHYSRRQDVVIWPLQPAR